MTRLRIAQLANFVGPVSGGMKVAIDHLGKGYVQAGHDRILVIPGAHDDVAETENGIIVQVAAPRVSKEYRMIATPWRALRILDRFRPTSIESSDKWTLSPAAGWARRRGVGSVLFSHERLDDMLSLLLRRQFGVEAAVGALNRHLSKAFDAVVVTSDYSAGEFADTGAHLYKVPLGVDLETFTTRAREPDSPTPAPDGILRLCYVGRMSHEKSPQLAVAAAVELHRRGVAFRLDMYGVGPDMEAMRQQAGDAPVFFNGFVDSRAEVARRFAAADISMSVCPAETFGLAVLEAMACGTPVVTSDRGGAHELVDETSGECGTPDATGLADAVERLAVRLGPDLRIAARARAEKYTWQASVDRMLDLHAMLAESVPSRPYWRATLRSRAEEHRSAPDPLAPTDDPPVSGRGKDLT
ncbi:glycosyltransferase [Acidipropionibacterium virtanenii]|uniref:GDP-mannose-dependent alpha-(1-6)-phosphatidylinositol dimannoside mannosyltransferase n=1 Tax=Acidipropionibacterium virtanenii TaxID=2057246 RepID=A0A344USB5_9ACTN|nr:glycosyltransferase [Acidipropionibacterium virtanenii]AXE38163.1 GDP-mannose-dependent alpha-(1-6)-phosphatidylinositol dimannoside mannosyltransferase [Acidipropionibacterium virtanenii]